MPIQTILFDLDETLYSPDSGLWRVLRYRMGDYMSTRLNIPDQQIPELRKNYFETYGTTLRGLERDFQIQAEDYLNYVHDVNIEDFVQPDPVLRSILESIPQKKVIFTNANSRHTEKVLRALGVDEYFDIVIDVMQMAPYCKPYPEAYHQAMSILGDSNPGHYLLLDDSLRNVLTALQVGMQAVLVNPREEVEDHLIRIDSIHELPQIWSTISGALDV